MENVSKSLGPFYSLSTVLLGGLAGMLISIPVASTFTTSTDPVLSMVGMLLLPLFALVGFRIGYLRRNNRAFFYISFLTVLVLMTLVMR